MLLVHSSTPISITMKNIHINSVNSDSIESFRNGLSVELLLLTYLLNYTGKLGNYTKETWLLVPIVEFDWFKQPCAIANAETFKLVQKI